MHRILFLMVILSLACAPMMAQNRDCNGNCKEQPKKFGEILGLTGKPVALIMGVEDDSIVKEYLSMGDLVTGFNGKTVRDLTTIDIFLNEMRFAAATDRAVMDILKYDPSTKSYSQDQVTAVIKPAQGENYIGLRLVFSYFVEDVQKGSPAHLLGIRPGDFIHEINGNSVFNLRGPIDLDLEADEAARNPQTEISFELVRWEPLEDGRLRGAESRKVRGYLNKPTTP